MEDGAVKIPRVSRKYEIGRKFGKETAPPGWRARLLVADTTNSSLK